MATAKLNVLMGILAYCVGQSTAIRPPPALLQGVGTVDMATAKLSVLMGILAYCVGQSTAIQPPPALLQGVGRDQLITLYFWEGFQYKAIICFLYFVHGIALSLR